MPLCTLNSTRQPKKIKHANISLLYYLSFFRLSSRNTQSTIVFWDFISYPLPLLLLGTTRSVRSADIVTAEAAFVDGIIITSWAEPLYERRLEIQDDKYVVRQDRVRVGPFLELSTECNPDS